ncbi:helix-turn-helix transcriptional regulator [Roseivivax sp. CAU 1761]
MATWWRGLSRRRGNRRTGVAILWAALALQAFSALTFLAVFWSEVLGIRSYEIDWVYVELAQILASAGLLAGTATSALYLRRSVADIGTLERQVDIASGNFSTHIRKVFDEWGLSPAEWEVALYAVKGLSNAEIADLRNTSVPTVKSQMTSIYRKSGLTTRQQLATHLIEDILAGVAPAASSVDDVRAA